MPRAAARRAAEDPRVHLAVYGHAVLGALIAADAQRTLHQEE
jgi:hypothetical protein